MIVPLILWLEFMQLMGIVSLKSFVRLTTRLGILKITELQIFVATFAS